MKTGTDDFFVAGHTGEDLRNLIRAVPFVQPRPTAVLRPGGLNETAAAVGRSLSYGGHIFQHRDRVDALNGQTVHLGSDGVLTPVSAARMCSEIERAARLVRKAPKKKKKDEEVDAKPEFAEVEVGCCKGLAELIMESHGFAENISSIVMVSKSPVLRLRNGKLEVITGYDRESGIHAKGCPPPEMTLSEAVQTLLDPFTEFDFATQSDKSRSMANVLSPAFTAAGLISCHAPASYVEADDSQAGKGFLHKCLAAVYNDIPHTVNQQNGGVGSLEEAFDTLLVAGRRFISFDNLVAQGGEFDSPKLCSFLTEDSYSARAPYKAAVVIDPRRHVVMVTTNRCRLKIDIANRGNPVRINKRHGYVFRSFPEGGLIEHVRANQPLLLGAVFTIAKAYHAAGCPLSGIVVDTGFNMWCRAMDWVVTNLMGLAPLMEGVGKFKTRAVSPDLSWLRDVALATENMGRLECELSASDIVDVCCAGGVAVPGLDEAVGADSATAEQLKAASLAVGQKMSRAFKLFADGGDVLALDSHRIDRRRVLKIYEHLGKARELTVYRLSRTGDAPGGDGGREPVDASSEPVGERVGNQSEPMESVTSKAFIESDKDCSTDNFKGSTGSIGSDSPSTGSGPGYSLPEFPLCAPRCLCCDSIIDVDTVCFKCGYVGSPETEQGKKCEHFVCGKCDSVRLLPIGYLPSLVCQACEPAGVDR